MWNEKSNMEHKNELMIFLSDETLQKTTFLDVFLMN